MSDAKILPCVGYLAGPYRDARGAHFVRENIESARRVALRFWQAGMPVICPHLNTMLMDGAAPDEVWLRGDLVILRRCDFLVLLPGWLDSSGAKAERAEAVRLGLPTFVYGGLELYTDNEMRDYISRHLTRAKQEQAHALRA